MSRFRFAQSQAVVLGTLLAVVLLATPSAATASPTLGPNLVRNGSFEYPDVAFGEVLYAGDSMGRWHVTRGSIDLLDVDYIWPAGTGDQSIDLAGYSDGSIVQRVATVPGQSYVLQFQLAVNVDKINCPEPEKTLIVRFGGRLVATIVVSYEGRDYDNMGWTWTQFRVVASEESSILAFHSSTGDTPCGPVLDSVKLRPVLV